MPSSWHGAVSWNDVQQLDAYLQGPVVADLDLPLEKITRHFRTNNFRLYPATEADYADANDSLEWVSVGFVTDLAEHITLLEGKFPEPASQVENSAQEGSGQPMEELIVVKPKRQ